MNSQFNGVLVFDFDLAGLTCKELYDVFQSGTLLFFKRSTVNGTYVALISLAYYDSATSTYTFTENFYSTVNGATVKNRYAGLADDIPAIVQ